MNAPTIIIALIVVVVFAAIVARGVRNWKSGKGAPAAGIAAPAMAAAIVNKKSDRHWKGDTDKGKLSMSLFPYGVRTKNGDQNITFTISADDL